MKSLSQFILEANSGNSDAFCEETAKMINDKKYADIVKKFAEAKANKEFPNMMWKNIGSKLNNLDTLFGFNEKNNAFFVAIYFERVRGIRGVLYTGQKLIDFEDGWVCPSWKMFQDKIGMFEDDNKCKFKMFYSTTPNRKLRRELMGGWADHEKY